MVNTSFRFDIGAFQCIVVNDGFINVIKRPLPGSSEKESSEIMDVACLLIKKEQRYILIDTGCGSSPPTAGKLLQNLLREGIKPSDINTIIYTHAHPDHIGGTVDAEGKLVYQNARQVVTKKEWDCLSGMSRAVPNDRMFNLARVTLLPIADRFDIVEDNSEVIPSIRLIPAPGHTLGGVIVEVSSGKERLLCIGDLIHSRTEFTQSDYYSFLDSLPEQAVTLRTRGLADVAASGALVFASHLAFPGIGRFVKKGGTLSWQPIQEVTS